MFIEKEELSPYRQESDSKSLLGLDREQKPRIQYGSKIFVCVPIRYSRKGDVRYGGFFYGFTFAV